MLIAKMMSQSVTALFLLLLPTLCATEMAEMAAEYELLVVNYGNSTGGNSTDPSSENEMAQDILGYTLIGIVVLMFFFTVCTFGKDCCVGCKNCCTAFSRYGCKGCCRFLRGRRPDGDEGGALLNEVIFDPDEEQQQQAPQQEDLSRSLLSEA
mmetsp:Transcript_28038/g.61095  ORF Transcript_28038/g.61095 Transcript_28038/m.61095 type:complete len:153 (+) Transcript_28038:40-498(+)